MNYIFEIIELLIEYWWLDLLLILLVTIFVTSRYQPKFSSYELTGRFAVKNKKKESKTRIVMTPISNGKTTSLIPVPISYTEITFVLSNGKTYVYEDEETDYLGRKIKKGDTIYVYESDSPGWGDSTIFSHEKMSSQDFYRNTSLFIGGLKIFGIIILLILGLIMVTMLITMIVEMIFF